ncbi:MAG: PDZ domain-containing protein [Desulfobacterales bacterium]|nr:PDZ domain-containing protein [Desulfobacterales bacterium]
MDIRSAMKKVPRYRWILWAAFLAAALFFVFQMDFLPGKPGAQVSKGFELLDSLMSHIRRDYLEERDPLQTAEGTYRGMVNSLDPLSAYLSKDLLAGYKARDGRETEPGAIVLKRYAAFPQVVAVVPKSPAETAGIRMGDLLSAIEGRNTLSMSLAEVKILLRGRDEKPVRLRVLRGNETLDLDVPRALLFPAAYTFVRAAGRPAVLSVRRIDASLVPELRKTVVPALKGGKTPLVLDLRSCQEGGIEEALALANLFLKAADAGRFEGRGRREDGRLLPR